MQKQITLRPAYGRKYITAKRAVEDFRAGKDFIDTKSNLYCNVQDCIQEGFVYAEIRWCGLRKTVVDVRGKHES